MNKRQQQSKKEFIRHYTLPAVVFLTGACVLIIELAAIRILSPYFGNTLYMTSSVLGIILAALSLGYYHGGRIADQRPSETLFYGIILAGGVTTLLIQLLALSVLPAVAYDLSIITGPLLMTLALFFIPALLLGMLSPFVIKLQTKRMPKLGTGTVAGEVFFWSTLGSITGSLATGFVLVPFFGLDATVLGTGIFLVLLGMIGLLRHGMLRNKWMQRTTALAVGLLVLSVALGASRNPDAVYSDDGLYQRLVIYDGEHEGKPTRFFQQDRNSSSAMYLNSKELVFDYSKYYELYRGVKPDATQSMVVGGAVYSIPKALLADSPDMEVDVSEIEPSLFELAKKYFRVEESPRLNNYVMDGRRLLVNSDKKYDLIFGDAYSSLYSVPSHLTTKEFFETAKSKMTPNGIFVANLIGDLSGEQPSFIHSQIKTFRQVFDNTYIFAVQSPDMKDTPQNVILVGINGDKELDLNADVFANSSNDILRNLEEQQVFISDEELKPHMVLKDNHAPVDWLMSRVLRESY